MTTTELQKEINSLPYELRQQVADFVAFLKTKNITNSSIKKREFGCLKGKIKLTKDFDDPLELVKSKK